MEKKIIKFTPYLVGSPLYGPIIIVLDHLSSYTMSDTISQPPSLLLEGGGGHIQLCTPRSM